MLSIYRQLILSWISLVTGLDPECNVTEATVQERHSRDNRSTWMVRQHTRYHYGIYLKSSSFNLSADLGSAPSCPLNRIHYLKGRIDPRSALWHLWIWAQVFFSLPAVRLFTHIHVNLKYIPAMLFSLESHGSCRALQTFCSDLDTRVKAKTLRDSN